MPDIFKGVNNKFARTLEDGLVTDGHSYYDTGVYALNAILSGSIYGGIPSNTVTAFAGKSQTGKTYLCLDIAQHFLERHDNGVVVVFDSEFAITSRPFESRNIDPKRVQVYPVHTVEDFRHQAMTILDNYLELKEDERFPILFILDSLGQLSTEAELGYVRDNNNKTDLKRAQIIKGAFRALTLRLGIANCPMIVTNHTYETIGDMFSQEVMPGGSGLYYAATNIMFLGKAKEKDKSEVIGSKVRCTMKKSRLTREHQIVTARIMFDRGSDRHYGLVDLALEAEVFTKVGNKIAVPGTDSTYFQKSIDNEPEKFFTEEVLKQIDEYCHKKFMFGSDYENWLEEKENDKEG